MKSHHYSLICFLVLGTIGVFSYPRARKLHDIADDGELRVSRDTQRPEDLYSRENLAFLGPSTRSKRDAAPPTGSNKKGKQNPRNPGVANPGNPGVANPGNPGAANPRNPGAANPRNLRNPGAPNQWEMHALEAEFDNFMNHEREYELEHSTRRDSSSRSRSRSPLSPNRGNTRQ